MRAIELKEFNTMPELKESMKNFIGQLNERLGVMATKIDLESFATKKDLEAFATKKDLEAFATKKDLEAFATKDDLETVRDSLVKGQDALARAVDSIRIHLGIKIDAEA